MRLSCATERVRVGSSRLSGESERSFTRPFLWTDVTDISSDTETELRDGHLESAQRPVNAGALTYFTPSFLCIWMLSVIRAFPVLICFALVIRVMFGSSQ